MFSFLRQVFVVLKEGEVCGTREFLFWSPQTRSLSLWGAFGVSLTHNPGVTRAEEGHMSRFARRGRKLHLMMHTYFKNLFPLTLLSLHTSRNDDTDSMRSTHCNEKAINLSECFVMHTEMQRIGLRWCEHKPEPQTEQWRKRYALKGRFRWKRFLFYDPMSFLWRHFLCSIKTYHS